MMGKRVNRGSVANLILLLSLVRSVVDEKSEIDELKSTTKNSRRDHGIKIRKGN